MNHTSRSCRLCGTLPSTFATFFPSAHEIAERLDGLINMEDTYKHGSRMVHYYYYSYSWKQS